MANKANNGTFGLLGWVARPPFGKRGGGCRGVLPGIGGYLQPSEQQEAFFFRLKKLHC